MGILASDFRQFIIAPTLYRLNLWSEAAENLLLGTAAQESLLGYYLKQHGGPALGVYQTEPASHQDIWFNYLPSQPKLADSINQLVGINKTMLEKEQALITHLNYATAIARIIYYRAAEPLPASEDIFGLALYWKQHYNTSSGKGEVADFVLNYRRLCYD
jgi:hypothetical protein